MMGWCRWSRQRRRPCGGDGRRMIRICRQDGSSAAQASLPSSTASARNRWKQQVLHQTISLNGHVKEDLKGQHPDSRSPRGVHGGIARSTNYDDDEDAEEEDAPIDMSAHLFPLNADQSTRSTTPTPPQPLKLPNAPAGPPIPVDTPGLPAAFALSDTLHAALLRERSSKPWERRRNALHYHREKMHDLANNRQRTGEAIDYGYRCIAYRLVWPDIAFLNILLSYCAREGLLTTAKAIFIRVRV